MLFPDRGRRRQLSRSVLYFSKYLKSCFFKVPLTPTSPMYIEVDRHLFSAAVFQKVSQDYLSTVGNLPQAINKPPFLSLPENHYNATGVFEHYEGRHLGRCRNQRYSQDSFFVCSAGMGSLDSMRW